MYITSTTYFKTSHPVIMYKLKSPLKEIKIVGVVILVSVICVVIGLSSKTHHRAHVESMI